MVRLRHRAGVKGSPPFAALADPHQRVHEAGKRALACHAAGDPAGAEAALTEMDRTAQDVFAVLDHLADDVHATAASQKAAAKVTRAPVKQAPRVPAKPGHTAGVAPKAPATAKGNPRPAKEWAEF